MVDLATAKMSSQEEEEDAHKFLQGVGAHGRRSQGTLSKFFSSSRTLLFKQDLIFSLWKDFIDHANKVYKVRKHQTLI